MRSVRFRKLMQGVHNHSEHHTSPYSFTVSPGVFCECQLECWREEDIRKMEQGLPYLALLQEFT
jgi:hypothetical protein